MPFKCKEIRIAGFNRIWYYQAPESLQGVQHVSCCTRGIRMG